MRKEVIILTTLLTILTSCNHKQRQENKGSIDSTANEIKKSRHIDLKSKRIDTLQTDLGLGLVSINFDDKTTLYFYSTPNDKELKRTIQFFNDQTINSWNIRDLDNHKTWLKPEILWLDYSQFVFRCMSVQGNWLKVVVNNENGETLWIKKNNLTTLRNWENYLKGMFGVARLPDHKQKIRSSPTDSSEEITYQGQDCFQVKSMKGDWIEIFTADYCDDSYTDSETKIKSGWIKWRQGNNLLIEYYTTS